MSDWDIEKYRADYESDEHWELRKTFMKKHKSKFTEGRCELFSSELSNSFNYISYFLDELVCLAAVFTNIEFLGCR